MTDLGVNFSWRNTAALASILAKVGIAGVNSNLATAIRTIPTGFLCTV